MSDDLHARVRELEDRLAIIELEGAYCRRFDERDGDGWAALFTGDGRYRSRGATLATDPGTGVYCEGRDQLATFCSTAPFGGIHLLHLPQLVLSGDTAEGRVHFEHVGAFDARPGVLARSLGYYDVTYARVGDRWLFADKVTTVFARDGALLHGYPA
jgi:hypothetical protein